MKATDIQIKKQIARISSMIDDMLALSGMMRGSFGVIYQRCGKPTCWCADTKGKGHLCMRLMWSDKDGVKTRSIRAENREAVKEAVAQYREFRKMRRKIRIEEIRLNNLLDEFERSTTINNKTKMGYL